MLPQISSDSLGLPWSVELLDRSPWLPSAVLYLWLLRTKNTDLKNVMYKYSLQFFYKLHSLYVDPFNLPFPFQLVKRRNMLHYILQNIVIILNHTSVCSCIVRLIVHEIQQQQQQQQ